MEVKLGKSKVLLKKMFWQKNMNLKKYKWKSRILLVSTPNYKDAIYLETKKIYQDKIKDFHKRHVKLICKIKKKKKSSINLIGFDGKSKKIKMGEFINNFL